MKSKIYNLGVIWLVAVAMLSCSDSHKSEAESHNEDAPHEGEIVIEPDDAQRFGLVTETVKKQDFNDVIKASGRIMSSSSGEATVVSPGPGIVRIANNINVGTEVSNGTRIANVSPGFVSGGNPNASARAAVNAAKREVDRLKPLLDEKIVTRREYDAAVAAYQSALASYSPAASSNTAVSPISGVITSLAVKTGDYVDAGTPIAMISRNVSLVLRVDLPEKYRSRISEIVDANIRTPYSDKWISLDSLNGRKNAANASDAIVAEAGYIPVYFTFTNNGRMAAGDFVDINVLLSSDNSSIAVPDAAIVEQMGNYFVYVKSGDHSYEKRKIEKGQSNGTLTQVTSGLVEGETVVIKGASMVRLAETANAVPEGHSHTH